MNAKKQCDKWGDFEMHVAPFDKDQPIYYEFTACPTAEFAKKHDLLEVMPALCNPDFAGMELIHARLIRKRPVRTAANATKIRLGTRFFCMIFSLDPMVPPLSFGMWRSSARQDRVRGEPQV